MIEKIDIIDPLVYCYDEQYTLIKTLELSQFQSINLPYFTDYKLYTINISKPIKRVVKFTELNDINTSAVFIEYPYDDMDNTQKNGVDTFITEVENL